MRTLLLLLLLRFLSLSRLQFAGRIRVVGVLEFLVVDAFLWRGFPWHGGSVCTARWRLTRCGAKEPYSHFKFEFLFLKQTRGAYWTKICNTDLSFAGHKFSVENFSSGFASSYGVTWTAFEWDTVFFWSGFFLTNIWPSVPFHVGPFNL